MRVSSGHIPKVDNLHIFSCMQTQSQNKEKKYAANHKPRNKVRHEHLIPGIRHTGAPYYQNVGLNLPSPRLEGDVTE